MAGSDFSYLEREFKPTDTLPYIKSPFGEAPIILRKLDIQVVVTGLYAETTQTMTFYNPNRRVLEGELFFPLPDGGTVCGYGLDIDGQMVDGVIVPKEEARKILETEIRKGVDPGLVEHVQGNLYRTRIYPIPAGGTRTVRLSYISDLSVQENDASYHLPLTHARGIDQVSLRVEVVQNPVQPEISSLGNLTINQWENRWVAEATLDTTALVDDFFIRLPRLPEQVVSVEKNDNGTFFNISRRLQPVDSQQWQASRIGIAWDASGSRSDHPGMEKELTLIRRLFEQCGVEQVDLLVFRNVIDPEIKSFTSAASLIRYLETIPYDGGTDLSGLDCNCFDPSIEACFLFTDGLDSGEVTLQTHYLKPVVTVNSSTLCNSDLLQFVASRSGGIYANLQSVSVVQTISALGGLGDNPKIAEVVGCTDVFIESGNGRVTVLGKLTADTATVSLAVHGESQRIVKISENQASPSRNISRAWAGAKLRQLSLSGDQSDEIISLGRQYGLVTPGTSLLVLETLEQYLEYDITPPESLPQIYEDFVRRKREQKATEEKDLKSQLDQVVQWWEERVAWWQEDFRSSYLKRLEVREENRRQRQHVLEAESRLDNRSSDRHHALLDDSEPERYGALCFSLSDDGTSDDFAVSSSERCESPEGESGEIPAPYERGSSAASITIQAWSPDTPYLNAMRKAEAGQVYTEYLQQRNGYAKCPSFFLDCGDYLFKQGQVELAIRVLSNLEELQLGDIALLRMYAWRLLQAGRLTMAIKVFERIRKIRDDEPQSHRDLALALSDRWQTEGNESDAVRAMTLLYDVIRRSWDRFPEIELIALMELNRLIHFAGRSGIAVPEHIDNRLIKNLDLDIRISMSWDADLTDVDLHVFEPDGGHAYYAHNRTMIGGLVSKDFTEGYGPEEYILHKAMPGTYTIKAHYYGSHQQKLCGPCTVTATVFTNFGCDDEQKQTLTLRLEEASDQELVGEIAIEGEPWIQDASQLAEKCKLLEKCRGLIAGLSIDEVKDLIGQPDEIQGDEEILLSYSLNNQTTIELYFSPKLRTARHIMDGCTVDIL